MSWHFLPGGLIMPSAAPMDEADPALTLGYRQIQVRARLTSHLEWFRDVYIAPFTDDYSEIEQTPHMDYNCRLYMTHEEFAQALARAVMDIDYRKFKPTAEGIDVRTGKPFVGGAKYHGVLNSIWGNVLRLAPAGGVWGPRSEDNPNGYTSSGRTGRGVSFNDHELEAGEPADESWWERHLVDGEAREGEAVTTRRGARRSGKRKKKTT